MIRWGSTLTTLIRRQRRPMRGVGEPALAQEVSADFRAAPARRVAHKTSPSTSAALIFLTSQVERAEPEDSEGLAAVSAISSRQSSMAGCGSPRDLNQGAILSTR